MEPLGFAPAEAFADVRERADEFLKEPTFVYRVNMPGKGGGHGESLRRTSISPMENDSSCTHRRFPAPDGRNKWRKVTTR